jgi:integrase/recombinase XerD
MANLASIYSPIDISRKVLFGEKTRQALERWLHNRSLTETDFIFTSLRNPRPVNPNLVIQMLRRRGRRSNVKGPVNPHAFRHGFAREYLRNGGDLGSVSDLLGHTQIAVTKANYAVFLIEEHREKHRAYSPVNFL